jgi:riboflavin synthase
MTMFTGIVENMGRVAVLQKDSDGLQLDVDVGVLDQFDIKPGDSIAVNGACLTATPRSRGSLIAFDVGPTTLALTNLKSLAVGQRVNIERALRLDQRLGGHMVTGHIDATAQILTIAPQGAYHYLRVRVDRHLSRYLILKGSCCLNGISLTIAGLTDQTECSEIELMIIPETWSRTNLSDYGVGGLLNLEVDAMAKFADRLRQRTPEEA